MDVSSEMIYSLVPIFLSSVLGVNKSIIGLIEGIAESTASMLKMLAGWLSDKLGRRKELMVFGYGVSTLSRPLLAVSAGWGMVLGSRFVDRFGKGVRTAPRDAIIADSTEKERLGRSFGFHRAMDQFGAVLGPAIAFLVLSLRPGGYRTVFWIRSFPGYCVFSSSCSSSTSAGGRLPWRIMDPRLDRTRRRPPINPAATGGGDPMSRLTRLRRLRGPLLAYLLVTAVFSLGNSRMCS